MDSSKTKRKSAKKYTWAEVLEEQLTSQMSRRVVSGERAMVAKFGFAANSVVALHAHPNEQLTYVLEGSLRLWWGEHAESEDLADSLVVSAGDVIVIPANVPHRAIALMDTVSLDIFAPPREDWLAGMDSYLKVGSVQ